MGRYKCTFGEVIIDASGSMANRDCFVCRRDVTSGMCTNDGPLRVFKDANDTNYTVTVQRNIKCN